MSKEAFYITTPIYYVNGTPHIGTAYTTIAADVIARWQRMDGRDVMLLTGLDEHGEKVARAAHEHGKDPQEWCDLQVGQFSDLWETLCISNDDFIRTTQKRHERGVARFMQKLYDAGYLYKGMYDGFYCVPCETQYTAAELHEQKCPTCGRQVDAIQEENWFFKLSDFGDKLLEFYDEHPGFIKPQSRENEVRAFIKSGLHDLSVSRSAFSWGVPLPFDSKHVTYVWVDALINYITALGYGSDNTDKLERYWPANFHFIGKDIIRFHCVIWPAMLMAAGMEVPKCVFAHGFLMAADGSKMSKSKGNALYPLEIIERYGVDAYRYYFMSDVNFGEDGNIGHDRITQVYNADLANTYGNLFSRVSNMVVKYFEGRVPCAPADAQSFLNPLAEYANTLYERYRLSMNAIDYGAAASAVMELLHKANNYIERSAPWKLAQDPAKSEELAFVLYNGLEACRLAALYLAPFMPHSFQELWSRLGLGDPCAIDNARDLSRWGLLKAGSPVTKGDALFLRLSKAKD